MKKIASIFLVLSLATTFVPCLQASEEKSNKTKKIAYAALGTCCSASTVTCGLLTLISFGLASSSSGESGGFIDFSSIISGTFNIAGFGFLAGTVTSGIAAWLSFQKVKKLS